MPDTIANKWDAESFDYSLTPEEDDPLTPGDKEAEYYQELFDLKEDFINGDKDSLSPDATSRCPAQRCIP